MTVEEEVTVPPALPLLYVLQPLQLFAASHVPHTTTLATQCFLLTLALVQALAAAVQQRMAQLATVHDNHIYTVERANSSKVPWLVVGPGGVCSVAHKLSVAPVYTCNDDSKHGKQLLVRLATALLLLVHTYAQHCA